MSKDVAVLAKFLYCSSVLEEKVAYAYKSLSERVENPLVKSLLLYISTDSLKHSVILKGISKVLFKNLEEMSIKDCEGILGEIWKKLALLADEEMLKKEKVGNAELGSLADKMAEFEGFVGEEYLTTLHLKIVPLMTKELKIDLGPLKEFLEWIIEDEERHKKILTTLKSVVNVQ